MERETQSRLHVWRIARDLSVQQLAQACIVSDSKTRENEAGESGLPGELEDYLAKQGECILARKRAVGIYRR